MVEIAETLAHSRRAYLIAPAGCGKTYQIARAVGYCEDGKQLVLTHTHAGVRSLREKLKKSGMPSNRYEVETIAGWALRIAAAYPTISGLGEFNPQVENNWPFVYTAATTLLSNKNIRKVIRVSYSGVFVDEYQDCTLCQHLLILALADLLPCKILGDPLQGIFGFRKEDRLVDWDIDIDPCFERLPDLLTPWRWANGNNPPLGIRLIELRNAILNGEAFDFRKPPIRWIEKSFQSQINVCYRFIRENSGTVVAIRSFANVCHSTASRLGGKFSSMEELECKDLMEAANQIESCLGFDRAMAVIVFATECMTGVRSAIKTTCNAFEKGKVPVLKESSGYLELRSALIQIAVDPDLNHVLVALPLFRSIDGSHLFRKELWYEMIQALKTYIHGGYQTLREAAWAQRNNTKELGRWIERRVVSRTLLVKGLEFDHSIVLDADELKPRDLYVAMTRGAKSLTVLSANPIFLPRL